MTKTKKGAAPNPWDRRAKPATGEETPDRLYHAVGIALSNWEALDELLTRVFARILEAKYDYADIVLSAVSGSNGRLTMIKKVVDHALVTETFELGRKDCPPSAVERVDKLRKLSEYLKVVEKFLPRRNDIAHAIVKSLDFNGAPRGYLLEPASYDLRKTDSLLGRWSKTGSFFEDRHGDWRDHEYAAYAFNSDDVKYYAEQFRRLCEVADNFFLFLTFGPSMVADDQALVMR